MTIGNQTSTRFKDEILIIPPWVFFLATLIVIPLVALMTVVIGGRDHNPLPLAVRMLLGVIAGTVLSCYTLLIAYVNRDAGRRGMSRLLWTLIAVFVPNGLGIVLYFVLRKPRTANCSQCDAEIEPGFGFCPRCRNRLLPLCPHCQRTVNSGDKFCPYCGGDLESAAGVSSDSRP